MFIYLVANNVINYLKHDVVTKVRETNEFPTYFPAITICNLIYFQTEYSKEFLIDNAAMYGLYQNNSQFFNNIQSLGPVLVVQAELNQTEIQKLGYAIDDMLLSCTFSQFSCNYTEFAWFFHPNYGYGIIFDQFNLKIYL